jgi:hypothetical protein
LLIKCILLGIVAGSRAIGSRKNREWFGLEIISLLLIGNFLNNSIIAADSVTCRSSLCRFRPVSTFRATKLLHAEFQHLQQSHYTPNVGL